MSEHREEFQAKVDAIFDGSPKVLALKAEIERLKGLVDKLRLEWQEAISWVKEGKADNERLKVELDKHPKTADGVPAYKDMQVFYHTPRGLIQDTELGWYCNYGAVYARELVPKLTEYRMTNGCLRTLDLSVSDCYSTREAALAAEKETPDDRL